MNWVVKCQFEVPNGDGPADETKQHYRIEAENVIEALGPAVEAAAAVGATITHIDVFKRWW